MFKTSTGEKVTHIGYELQKLSDAFGKKFTMTPTLNRKAVATAVGLTGSDADERNASKHMTHSVDVHRDSYQHSGGAEQHVCKINMY